MGLPGVLESPTSALQVRRSPSELQEHVMDHYNLARNHNLHRKSYTSSQMP